MLECPSDHPAATCPYLADTVDHYLDTGEIPAMPLGTPRLTKGRASQPCQRPSVSW